MSVASPLSSQNILDAVDEYESLGGRVDSYTESTGYDVVIDRKRFPPKAIFGIALSQLLGADVQSHHFAGGKDSECFRTLEALGFNILAKPRPTLEDGLFLHKQYSRMDAARIFDPEYVFRSAGSGKWSPTGIIKNVPREGDFVFFVTLDEGEGNDYEDYFTADGAFAWKSQNQHTPDHPDIRKLVAHDDTKNTIYLFIRRNKSEDYTYLGPLIFRDWNPQTSKPVHFFWDLVNWPLPADTEKLFCNHIKPALTPGFKVKALSSLQLKESLPPELNTATKKQKMKKVSCAVNWEERERRNRFLGEAGEIAVLELEREFLEKEGRADLADKVTHVAKLDPSAGYDILSYTQSGQPIFIEVKTTTLGKNTPFFVSRNEVEVSKELKESYWVYRLYDFKYSPASASFYKVQGSIPDHFKLIAETFKAYR